MRIAERILADVDTIAPAIAERAADIEQARAIPEHLLAGLHRTGVFRAFLPGSHGGLQLTLVDGLRAMTRLARADASVGWNASIWAGSALFATSLPRQTFDRIFADDPQALASVITQASGKAEKAAGGWRVSGRWSFASGCQHAGWLAGTCAISEPGPGAPASIGCIVPKSAWRIEDTWHVPGLKATCSTHIALTDCFVPDEHVFGPHRPRWVADPLGGIMREIAPLFVAAPVLGIAEGALEDLLGIVRGGRQERSAAAPMRDSEFFLGELGALHADLRAAQALLDRQAERGDLRAIGGLPAIGFDLEVLQAVVRIGRLCRGVVDACFEFGGSHALYEPAPLQRRLRDIHVALEHNVFHRRHYAGAGAALLREAEAENSAAA